MHLEAGFLAGFGQSLEIILPVDIIQEDVVPAVAPAHHMINGTQVLHSHFVRHETKDAIPADQPQAKCTILWVDKH
jgi:hypothetical protein